jgi:molybdopterin-guanine dinucleotide biosynthesis protein B
MKVFSVTGYSKSGKTTTIELVIKELTRRGFKVGSVKEIHNEGFALDNDPVSNTNRHRMAGSELVTARGLTETDIMFPSKLDARKIFSFYDGFDYVICEGVRDYVIPTIMTSATLEDLEPKWSDYTFCVSGKIADEINEYKGVPAISAIADVVALVDLIEEKVFDILPNAPHCGACGKTNCHGMAISLLRGEAKRSECEGNSGVDLVIGGKRVDMQPFVEKIMRSTVLGFLSELRGYEEGSEVKITIR